MVKGKLLEDTFEQLVELGQSTVKKSVKSVVQTINPLSVLDKQSEVRISQDKEQNGKTMEVKKGNNYTPLDFEKLQNKFKEKEKIKTEALRYRLFQMVKQADERLIMEKRQEEMQNKRQELYLQKEQKRKEEEKKKNQAAPLPRGKIRQSIFSPKKIAQQQHAETKPATGKQ